MAVGEDRVKLAAPTIDAVRAAAALIARRIRRTPLVPIDGGHLKLESLQPTASFNGVGRRGATVIPLPFQELLDWMTNERWHDEPELFIHPFADEAVMTGNGTVALEILDQLPEVDRVVVPVGGGGLVVGVAATIKAIRPEVEVVGVQSDGYPLWRDAFQAGGPVSLKPNTIADGTTGPFTGAMFELLHDHVDRWVVVPEGDVRRAVAELAIRGKVVAE